MLIALRLGLVCLCALLLQLTLFSRARVAGVAPELPALVAVMSGLLAGVARGCVVAFCMGLMWDLYLPTPLGLAAVSFALVAHALAAITEDLFHDTRTQMVALVFVGTAAAVTAHAVLGELLGQRGLLGESLPRIVLVASASNAVLALALAPVMRWALTGKLGRPGMRLTSVPRPS